MKIKHIKLCSKDIRTRSRKAQIGFPLGNRAMESRKHYKRKQKHRTDPRQW